MFVISLSCGLSHCECNTVFIDTFKKVIDVILTNVLERAVTFSMVCLTTSKSVTRLVWWVSVPGNRIASLNLLPYLHLCIWIRFSISLVWLDGCEPIVARLFLRSHPSAIMLLESAAGRIYSSLSVSTITFGIALRLGEASMQTRWQVGGDRVRVLWPE